MKKLALDKINNFKIAGRIKKKKQISFIFFYKYKISFIDHHDHSLIPLIIIKNKKKI
jgi:hypothetical protein